VLHAGADRAPSIIALMTTETVRPETIRVQLGQTLRRRVADRRSTDAGLTRLALRGIATGLVLGLVVGTAVTPSLAGVLVTGGASLAYALLTFATERPEVPPGP